MEKLYGAHGRLEGAVTAGAGQTIHAINFRWMRARHEICLIESSCMTMGITDEVGSGGERRSRERGQSVDCIVRKFGHVLVRSRADGEKNAARASNP